MGCQTILSIPPIMKLKLEIFLIHPPMWNFCTSFRLDFIQVPPFDGLDLYTAKHLLLEPQAFEQTPWSWQVCLFLPETELKKEEDSKCISDHKVLLQLTSCNSRSNIPFLHILAESAKDIFNPNYSHLKFCLVWLERPPKCNKQTQCPFIRRPDSRQDLGKPLWITNRVNFGIA